MSEAEIENLDAEIAEELRADEQADDTVDDAVLQQAIDEGYNPDKSKLPEGTEFVTPEEYLKRGTFFRKIDTQKAEIERLKAQFNHLSDNYRKANERDLKKAEAEFKKTIDGLKAEKVQAMDEGDHQRVVEIDEQMQAAQEPQAQQTQQPISDPAGDKLFTDWKTDNPWYDTDKVLRKQADMMSESYKGTGTSFETVLSEITADLKDLFPHKFENPRRKASASVEGGGSPRPKTGKVSEKSLTKEELEMYRDLGMEQVLTTDAKKQEYFQNVINQRD